MKKLILLIILISLALMAGCGEFPRPALAVPEDVPVQNSPPTENPTSTGNTAEYDHTEREPETRPIPDTDVSENSPYTYEEPPYDCEDPFYIPENPSGEYPGERPMIALTFDDGPSIHTERILDLLERYNARATFFVVGNRVEQRQDIVIRTVNLGSEIAGHSWAHCNFNRLSEEEISENITETSAVIESVLGSSVNFFRPPFGAINERGARVSYELGYAIINWTADTQDWKYRDANTVFNAVMNLAEDGAVILLHDIHSTTADAMELAIPALVARGYQLVTVSELLYHFYGELEPGQVYGRPGKVD